MTGLTDYWYAGTGTNRRNRRLADLLIEIVKQACDLADLDVAKDGLLVLDQVLLRPAVNGKERRKPLDVAVGAHQRLWHLRNPGNEPYAGNESVPVASRQPITVE